MAYKYSTEITENFAKALGLGLPISQKQSIMICNAIRGLNVSKAKDILQKAVDLKQAVPFTKFNNGAGHKPGIAAGKYPVKACSNILKILNSAEANAQYKGLSTGNLKIKHISAQEGPHVMRGGRRRREAKRTHVEIVLEEVKEAKK